MSIAEAVGPGLFRLGSSGPVVQAIQLGLREVGFPLKGTGYFANATDTAVRAFQRRAGLTADGVVGAKTAAAIDTAMPGVTIAPPKAVRSEIGMPLWLQAGIPLIGLREGAGSSDNAQIIEWAKEEGGAIAKEYTHDSIPWCALFGNHLLTKVSLPGTETLWALDFAGKWPSVRLDGPAVGAFAPMLRDGGGHIICIAGKAASGNVMGLGGNQRDSVSIEEFANSRLNKGFWWPAGVPLPALIGLHHMPIISSNGRISANEA